MATKSLEKLIDEFNRLPGIGRKSATRLAFHILDMEDFEKSNRETFSAVTGKLQSADIPICTTLIVTDLIVEKLFQPEVFLARPELEYMPSSYLERFNKGREKHLVQFQGIEDLAIAKYGFEALLLGIRRDEHGIRAKERYFSPRDEQFKWNYQDQPSELWDQYKNQAEEKTHIRVHPLLHWAEVDIWRYIQRENIPITELYFSRDGMRYRSIGCTTCCNPVESGASTVDEIIEELETTTTSERAGRAQDKEDTYTMQKLRALGYM